MLRITELRLGRKGVSIQPIQEIPAVGPNHFELRCVQVGINESRRDERVAAEVDHRAIGWMLIPRPDTGNAGVIDRQEAVVVGQVGFCRVAAKRVGDRRKDTRAEQLHGGIVGQLSVRRRWESLPQARRA